MNEQKLQQYIETWLTKYHAPTQHRAVLEEVLIVGKSSKPWVEAIQRFIQDVAFQLPKRGDVKRACRALLQRKYGFNR